MARKKIARLTARTVKGAKRRGMLHDGRGLYLSIAANGSKSWTFRYGAQGRHHFGLGPLDTVTLREARERARQARLLLLDGKDPITERRAQRAAQRLAEAKSITFAKAAATYIRSHHAAWKNDKNRRQWQDTLETYVFPVIGELPVAEVDTALVLRCVEPIWKEKTETASRVRRRIERVLAWATTHGYRSGPNPAAWSDHLDNLLPATGKVAPIAHHPAMPFVGVPGFVRELHSRHGIAPLAMEFLVLTAARTAEVLGATWSEFDLDGATWTVPPERMKAGKEHRVPLSSRAVEILRALPRKGAGPFRLSDTALRQLLRRMKRSGITPHGFRSSFRDWAPEVAGAPREVAEAALAHAIGNEVERAYHRTDLFAKRRRLMDDWATYCSGQAPAGKVVALHG
jgi:integrase